MLAGLLLAGLILSGCISQENSATGMATLTAGSNEKVSFGLRVVNAEGEAVLQRYTVVEKGVNAFEAMKKLVPVEYTESTYGAFIKSINGLSPDAEHYWALYVNGEYADKGISSYSVDEAFEVEWRMESLSDFPTQ